MPTAREHLTSSGVNGKVYSSGGRSNGMYFNVDSNEVYDITNKWATLELMPSKRGVLLDTVVNDSIYVFGSEQPDRAFNNNEKYDITIKKWMSEKDMKTARHGLAVVF